MKKFIPHLIWIAGLGIAIGSPVIASFLGGGIPYQDPTPEQAARESAVNGIFKIGFLIGLALFIIGFIWALIRMVIWLVTRLKS
ncbi:hypothetical protein N8813_00900 [bacterium]|nr:hypothetical protein [bacterium]